MATRFIKLAHASPAHVLIGIRDVVGYGDRAFAAVAAAVSKIRLAGAAWIAAVEHFFQQFRQGGPAHPDHQPE